MDNEAGKIGQTGTARRAKIATWQERMPEPRNEFRCSMNCSPRHGVCDDCMPVTVRGDAVAARDAEIADLRMALANSLAAASEGMEDPIIVPRGLIGSACYVLRKDAGNEALLSKLRAFTFGAAPMNRSAGMRCPICCAKAGEMHLPSCPERSETGQSK